MRYENRSREFSNFLFFAVFPPDGTRYPLIRAQLPTDVDQTTVDASLLRRVRTSALQHRFLVGATLDDTDYGASVGFGFTSIGVLDYADPSRRPSFGAPPPITRTQTDRYNTLALYVQDQWTWASGCLCWRASATRGLASSGGRTASTRPSSA